MDDIFVFYGGYILYIYYKLCLKSRYIGKKVVEVNCIWLNMVILEFKEIFFVRVKVFNLYI